MHTDFEILSELGRGGQAITWKARHVATDRLVALKELHFNKVEAWKTVELFEREAAALRGIEHPGVPGYIDAFTEEIEGELRLFLAQEFVEGGDLQQAAAEGGRWDEASTLEDLAQVLEILVYLHERVPPIIHRDLKPSNLLRRPDGRLCLVDFGAVQFEAGAAMGSTVIGTPGYMPMEQMLGQAEPRSDLYALGVTFGHLMTGKAPTQLGLSGMRLDFRAHIDFESHALAIIEKLTEPQVDRRFRSARQALDAMRSGPSGTLPNISEPTDPLIIDKLTFGDAPPAARTLPYKRVPSSFWSTLKKGRVHVVDRRQPEDVHLKAPFSTEAQRLGFRFLGRQTRFGHNAYMDANIIRSCEVWVDGTGKNHLVWLTRHSVNSLSERALGTTSDTLYEGEMSLVNLVAQGGTARMLALPIKRLGNLDEVYGEKTASMALTGSQTVLTGLDMDQFMSLYDRTWLGLPPDASDKKPAPNYNPITRFKDLASEVRHNPWRVLFLPVEVALLALVIVSIPLLIVVFLPIVAPFVMIAWLLSLWRMKRVWKTWQAERAAGGLDSGRGLAMEDPVWLPEEVAIEVEDHVSVTEETP